jgi:hypothetical protein
VQHRFLTTSIVSLSLLACGGSSKPVEETVARPHIAASSGSSKAPASAPKAAATTPGKSESDAARDAKTAAAGTDEEYPLQDFSGVDTVKPVDEEDIQISRNVDVKGIEGTTTRYDVRTTLESRDPDFDRCHDLVGGSGGKLVFKIHIMENGDVGEVKVRRIKVRNQKLVDCYTEVVSTSHFSRPHGGYADVKWTTKVGRSRKRPDIFVRKARWDTPAGGRQASGKRGKQRNGA